MVVKNRRMIKRSFSLDVLLANLAMLEPRHFLDRSPSDVEWLLADFILSLGQRLPLTGSPPRTEPQSTLWSRFGKRYLPFAIAPDFPAVGQRPVYTLALATACGILHIRLLDLVVDEGNDDCLEIKVAVHHVLLRFARLLGSLFSVEDGFWDQVQDLLAITSQVIVVERQEHGGTVRPFPWHEFVKISQNKMAFGMINAIGLAYLNHTPQAIPVFQECWNAIGLAAIINDDVLDWQEDFARANYTHLLSEILLSPVFADEVRCGRLPSPAEIGVALYVSELVETLYARARAALGSAYQIAKNHGFKAMTALVNETNLWIQSREHDIQRNKISRLLAPPQVSSLE